MWAGTAINDTSSAFVAGQTWTGFHGSDVELNYAAVVKLTHTLAIIPISLMLALYRSKKIPLLQLNYQKYFQGLFYFSC